MISVSRTSINMDLIPVSQPFKRIVVAWTQSDPSFDGWIEINGSPHAHFERCTLDIGSLGRAIDRKARDIARTSLGLGFVGGVGACVVLAAFILFLKGG